MQMTPVLTGYSPVNFASYVPAVVAASSPYDGGQTLTSLE